MWLKGVEQTQDLSSNPSTAKKKEKKGFLTS
jgi:hypothetical protein